MRSPVAIDILLRANADWVDLSDVVWVVSSVGGKEDADEIEETVLDAIRELMSDELVVIGDVGTDGFSQWRLPVDEALERVSRE